MPYLTNKIGSHEFIALLGNPMHPAMRVAIDDRPGVTGSEIMLIGVKGQPFSLISQVDTDNFAAAHAKYNEYLQQTAGAAVELVIGGVSSYTSNFAVKVLAVEAIRLARISTPVGNKKSTNGLGWCECRWDLIGIPLE